MPTMLTLPTKPLTAAQRAVAVAKRAPQFAAEIAEEPGLDAGQQERLTQWVKASFTTRREPP